MSGTKLQKIRRSRAEIELRSWWGRCSLNQQIVLSFLALIVLGFLVLYLPLCWTGERASWIDCLFLSTSAVCVTGLSPLDVAAQLSFAGKTTLLVLIELGGLGTMTLATFFLTLAQSRSSLKLQMSVEETFQQGAGQKIRWLAIKVIGFAVFMQALGALALFYHWKGERLVDPDLAFQAIFHSVSSFCNAGFSIFAQGLYPYRDDFWTNAIVIGLVVVGGLGYFVHFELGIHSWKAFGRKRIYLSLQSKVVLFGTALLLLLGTWTILLLEHGKSLAHVPVESEIGVAFFNAAMTRTAGFNTIDWGLAREASCFLAMGFMFIGAGPGSTAGGVKITTAAVLAAVITSRLRGRQDVVLFRRIVPPATILRAVYVVLLSLVFVVALIAAILVVESFLHSGEKTPVLAVAFESVSAFATVGLSMGITGALSWASKILLCVGMIAGRVGILTLSLAIYEGRREEGFSYPEEDLMIG